MLVFQFLKMFVARWWGDSSILFHMFLFHMLNYHLIDAYGFQALLLKMIIDILLFTFFFFFSRWIVNCLLDEFQVLLKLWKYLTLILHSTCAMAVISIEIEIEIHFDRIDWCFFLFSWDRLYKYFQSETRSIQKWFTFKWLQSTEILNLIELENKRKNNFKANEFIPLKKIYIIPSTRSDPPKNALKTFWVHTFLYVQRISTHHLRA